MRVKLSEVHAYHPSPSGPVKILEDVNLEIPSGGFVSVMGPSGSGKTTLLQLLGCLDLPSFGRILLEDTDVTVASEPVRERIRLHHVGFIFQNFNLLPTLTVLENVTLPMQLAGLKREEQLSRGHTLLRLVGLESRAREATGRLSGGQQQRVAIARALSNLPGLILADEPTGNLDVASTREIMDVLRSINVNQQITTVLVTHDPLVAAQASHRYILDQHRLTERPKSPQDD